MEELDFGPGVSLLKQNEPADAVYFLRTGAVQILVDDEIVTQIDKAQCFGEMSCLLPQTPASASVVTAQKCRLFRIAKDDFLFSANQITKIWKMLFLQMSERVRAVNGRLSEILRHLPQGLVKVSPEGIVSNDYSMQCTKFFQRDNIAGLSFPKLAFPGDESKQKSWLENLSLLFSESNMSFEMCAGLLASEFSLRHEEQTKYFTMTYSPCQNAFGKIIAVDIGIEDVTREVELERKHYEAKIKQEILAKITQGPDSFLNFLALADEVYADTTDFLAELKARGPSAVQPRIELMMRRLHSLKGISGVFSLQDLKAVIHDAETTVSRLKEPGESSQKTTDSLDEKLKSFQVEKDRAHGLFDEMPADLRSRLVGVVFSQDEFQNMKAHIEKSDWVSIQRLLASVEKVDSKKLFVQWPQEAQKIAAALGKSVQFNIAGEGGRISKELFTQLDNVLIHLLRNGLDHGLEAPEERAQKGKAPQGRITAMVDVSDTELMIAVEDDGRGINREALTARARQKKDLDQNLVAEYVAKSEEWKILLMPGFSTAKDVTDLSGRGVGLDAVASVITGMGGSLSIESTSGEGMVIFITVPI